MDQALQNVVVVNLFLSIGYTVTVIETGNSLIKK